MSERWWKWLKIAGKWPKMTQKQLRNILQKVENKAHPPSLIKTHPDEGVLKIRHSLNKTPFLKIRHPP